MNLTVLNLRGIIDICDCATEERGEGWTVAVRSFMELLKRFEEAKPEHKNMVINMLKEQKA